MKMPLKNRLAHYEKAQWTLGALLALGLGFFFVIAYRPATASSMNWASRSSPGSAP